MAMRSFQNVTKSIRSPNFSVTERERKRPISEVAIDNVTGRASGATNCRTDSNLPIAAPGSARPIHYPDKFYSSRRRDTGLQLGRA